LIRLSRRSKNPPIPARSAMARFSFSICNRLYASAPARPAPTRCKGEKQCLENFFHCRCWRACSPLRRRLWQRTR
jgi:hypothetical protein